MGCKRFDCFCVSFNADIEIKVVVHSILIHFLFVVFSGKVLHCQLKGSDWKVSFLIAVIEHWKPSRFYDFLISVIFIIDQDSNLVLAVNKNNHKDKKGE